MIDFLLKELEKYLNIKAIKGSGNYQDFFLLKIGEGFEIWVKGTDPGFFLRSHISMMITHVDKEDLFIYLSRANFLGQGTGGSVISIDPDEKFLTLSLYIPYEVNYRLFRDKLEEFINYLDYWRGELKRIEEKGLNAK